MCMNVFFVTLVILWLSLFIFALGIHFITLYHDFIYKHVAFDTGSNRHIYNCSVKYIAIDLKMLYDNFEP